ncbi:MAG: histidine kinase [Candidatus Eisenbacteria bacterium]|uniref:histidine kinase n=1 Tax=Eiseniibacteriota bacterium TaxID=2212470 RepID=A0A933S934_UNCEI|nr:histidine kinase [Candidatus Eisenbacteria bacterium]
MNAPVVTRPARSPRRNHLTYFLLTPLWAIPFTLFFGLLNGSTWETYKLSFAISLVFAFSIRYALIAAEKWVVPNVLRAFDTPHPHWIVEGVAYTLTSILGSYVAAWLVQLFVWPHFLNSSSAWVATGLYSLLFATLFSGIIYARVFYRQAIERAQQVERIRAELAQAELRALRAQINPHFLFNTLNAIASLISENPDAAEDVVTRLADVFRYALTSSSREHAKLADELAFLRSYLAIERVRLGDRLRVEERIEPGVESALLPSLLLQPLVENAVRYAVAPREAGGTIRLEARRVADTLEIVVGDDGPGFLPGASPSGHGVGLESVRERLRLAGPGHELTVHSTPGRGAQLLVTLPWRT